MLEVLAQITTFKPNVVQLCHLISVINKSKIELQGSFEQDKRMLKLMLVQLVDFA